jgi:hypothetical protein
MSFRDRLLKGGESFAERAERLRREREFEKLAEENSDLPPSIVLAPGLGSYVASARFVKGADFAADDRLCPALAVHAALGAAPAVRPHGRGQLQAPNPSYPTIPSRLDGGVLIII